jgi:hypothetical protein
MKRQELLNKLNKELKRLYHNATLHGSLVVESDFERDLFDETFQLECEAAIDSLNDDLTIRYPMLSAYGPVYQFGRGGRTLAFEGLVDSGGYPLDVRMLFHDRSTSELEQILTEIARFNEEVRDWCQTVPDAILLSLRKKYREELAQNKGKKRAIMTVYR